MKCSVCGSEIPTASSICDVCGSIVRNGKTYPNRMAAFLDDTIYVGNGSLSIIHFIRILLINLTVITASINAVVFFGYHTGTIWCQYCIGAFWMGYHAVESFCCARTHLLRHLRRVFYFLMATLLITQFFSADTPAILLYAWPVVLIVLDAVAVVLALGRWTTGASFAVTLWINILIGLGAALYLYFTDRFDQMAGVVLHITAFSLSVFLWINYVSMKLYVKRGRTFIWKR